MRGVLALLAMLVAPVGSECPVRTALGARRLVDDVRLSSRCFTLPNGLRVVVREDRRLPIACRGWSGGRRPSFQPAVVDVSRRARCGAYPRDRAFVRGRDHVRIAMSDRLRGFRR